MLDCLQRHKKRNDFKRLMMRIGGLTQEEYRAAIVEHDQKAYFKAARNVAIEAAERIRRRDLKLPPVTMAIRVDASSGKERLIGKESAMQQVFDHIAVGCCESIWQRRIVPQQVSSIAGRGHVYGVSMIQRWAREDNRAARWAESHGKRYSRKCRYFCQSDVRKCYQSARVGNFMALFERDCGNRTLLWLWRKLLESYLVDGNEGFMIGALPSQWAVQYMLSFAYRYVMGLHTTRRGVKSKLVSHMLLNMDDILLTGSSRTRLLKAMRELRRYLRDVLGFDLKPTWHIYEWGQARPDMMGFVIFRSGVVSIRARIFLRMRRACLRHMRTGRMTLRQARRLCSYKGYAYQSRHKKRPFRLDRSRIKMERKLKLALAFRRAAGVVSKFERRKNSGQSVLYHTA